jgi:hypothetical protein
MRGKHKPGLLLLGALVVAVVCATSMVRAHAQEPPSSAPPRERAAPASASPLSAHDVELTIQVESWLTAGIETSGAHDKILALGDRGERALVGVFEREAAPRYVRLRALSELGSFGTEASALYLLWLVHRARTPDTWLGDLHPSRSPLALRRALEGLVETAHLLGAHQPLDDVSWCLSHPDAHVRRVASNVLATLDDSASRDALQKHLASERSRMVRSSVTRALAVRAAP